MIGKGKFIEPDSYDNIFIGFFFVSFAGTSGELLAIALMCYAGDEAEKLVCSHVISTFCWADMDVSADSFNRQRRQFQPSPERDKFLRHGNSVRELH
jgi:hypothetical protein